jgi:hypothetical protein
LVNIRMSYYHWASKPVKLHRRNYPQSGHPKPNGLWFDVNGSWKRWCTTMQFHLEDLHYRHAVTILDTSRMLFLKNMDDIDRFTRTYGHNLSSHIQPLQNSEDMHAFAQEYGQDLFGDILAQFSNYILWEEVAVKYTGIIVDPYYKEKSLTYLWYYGWNCAGGCIWDTNVILLGKPLKLGPDE